ncbi:hypothetical protein GCM10009849_25020 [Sinomonas flava]|uniref:Uncharacterized protein n=1 Tax=Sinomonas flava TaxID=496857 RepID=A0ABP5NRR4_9MICC
MPAAAVVDELMWADPDRTAVALRTRAADSRRLVEDQYRARRVLGEGGAHGAEEHSLQSAEAAGADDQKPGIAAVVDQHVRPAAPG